MIRGLHFYPERIAWIGIALLSLGSLFALRFLWMLQDQPNVKRVKIEKEVLPSDEISFSLKLNSGSLGFSIPDLQKQMTFSFDPPRPDGELKEKRLLVRMVETGKSKRVVLPCRLDLEFQGTQLRFAKEKSLFWIDLAELPSGEIEGLSWIFCEEGTKIDAGQFRLFAGECPIQGAQEFPEGSIFKTLAEAKWLGKDLLRPADSGERIELSELLELHVGDWLVFREGKWQKSNAPEKDIPIAKFQSLTPKMLILEAWDGAEHTRIGLQLSPGTPFKMRAEELISSLRVRSEKQISCMLEKQCVVLKVGDWVLKSAGRWKVLRKKDDKDAFFNGKLSGELFILDQILQKHGQKVIQGRLFNPGRTQIVAVEMALKSSRKGGK